MHEESAQIAPGREPRRRELIETVVQEHESPLLGYALRLVGGDLSSAQDVVQNVFIKLLHKWPPGMRPGKKLKAWLFRSVHNEAVDLVRKDQRRKGLHEREAVESGSRGCSNPYSELVESDRKKLVLSLLERLGERERQVVLLRLQQGLSYKEIADVTGRTVGNVGNILHHAVQNLAVDVRRLERGLA